MSTLAAIVSALAVAVAPRPDPPGVTVGSKKFTESLVLAEAAVELAESAGARATHRAEMGGTRVLWDALLRGDIDLYPEYTGTLAREILAGERITGDADLRRALAERGIEMGPPLGFEDTYAIGMRRDVAERLGIRTLSDLARHPEVRLGLSHEFLDRADGWPLLRSAYGLPQSARGLDHDLAYQALKSGGIDATELYSTDPQIARLGLRVLDDDRRVFPRYDAVYIYRADLEARAPEVIRALAGLAGRIPAMEMAAMNARAQLDRVPPSRVVADFLSRALGLRAEIRDTGGAAARILGRTREHLFLVLVSLLAAILISVPLGVIAARWPRVGQAILAAVGLVQTIPSLALLVFMIPLLGIGARPAIAALFLYSLLPVVRNTYSGLRSIPLEVRDSAEALGLPPAARLRLIELPMASPSILAGVKTSAVINVGTATLGALIGAGGYGQPILSGIRLDDFGRVLEGAVPAAILALAVQALFDLAERALVPRGLRIPGESR